jgi:hypothetical protein
MNQKNILRLTAFTVALIHLSTPHGSAKTWDGGAGNGSWQSANNWDPDGVPSNGNTTDIIFNGSAATYLGNGTDGFNRVIRSLTVNGGSSTARIRFNATNASGTGINTNNLRMSSNTGTASITLASAVSAPWDLGSNGAASFGNLDLASHLLITNNSESAILTISTLITESTAGRNVTLEGVGRTNFNRNIGYTGTTTVNGGTLNIGINATHALAGNYTVGASGSLIVQGITSTSLVTVNGNLSGRGTFTNATLAGSGSINPGNSPGILTAAATNPTAGLDYNFEFTAANTLPDWTLPASSVNDVLRLTSATPFTASLSSANVINVYLSSLADGDVFTGGFYTDNNAHFLATIGSATFQYFLADAAGTETYLGNTYNNIGASGFSVATVAQTADFGAGDVHGYVTQFTYAIPEPSTALLGGIGALLLLRRRRA